MQTVVIQGITFLNLLFRSIIDIMEGDERKCSQIKGIVQRNTV